MEHVLREAVEPVLRDLDRAGLDAPRFEDDDWIGDSDYASSMMWAADGSRSGFAVRRAAPLAERVAQAADQVQEWAIEGQLWGSAPTNWPPCPHHPETHPLAPSAAGSVAVWVCPADQVVVTPIGGTSSAGPATTRPSV